MDLIVSLQEGGAVDVAFDGFVVHTDRAKSHGGAGTGPEPFDVFLAAIGACAGAYVRAFCEARNIATAGIVLHEHCVFDEKHRLERVEIEIDLPPTFPD